MLRVSNSRPTPCKGAALPTELSIRTSPSPRSEKREVTNCTGNFGCVGAWAKKKFCSLRPCAQNLSCLQVPHLGRRRIFRRLHAYDSSRGELDHYRPLRVAALTALFSSDILTVAVLQNNNLRDIPTDRRAGIRTFASVLGNRPAFLFNLAAFLLIGELPRLSLPAIAASIPPSARFGRRTAFMRPVTTPSPPRTRGRPNCSFSFRHSSS